MRSSTSSFDGPSVPQTVIDLLSRVPLIRDLLGQRTQLKVFLGKLCVFLVLFGIFDRLAAWMLLKGMDRSLGLDVPARVLCVGHSHTGLGIDKTVLENELEVQVAKYARNGANLADRSAMIKHYLEHQPSSVEVLVYDVSAHTFTGAGLSRNSYTLFYPFMDSPSVDVYVRKNAPWLDYYIRQVIQLRRFDLDTCNAAIRGWLRMWANLKHGQVDMVRLRKQIAGGDIRSISFDQECIDLLDETISFAVARDIVVVLLYIPTVDIYNAAEPEAYDRAIRMLQDRAARSEKVTFLDYNPVFSHRHELFYDPIHLNPQGQRLVTERLAQDLKRILGQMPHGENVYVEAGYEID